MKKSNVISGEKILLQKVDNAIRVFVKQGRDKGLSTSEIRKALMEECRKAMARAARGKEKRSVRTQRKTPTLDCGTF